MCQNVRRRPVAFRLKTEVLPQLSLDMDAILIKQFEQELRFVTEVRIKRTPRITGLCGNILYTGRTKASCGKEDSCSFK